MALTKRDRFSFRWKKSELPDNNDINTQVLLLGITRFETTPSPVPSIKNLLTTVGNPNARTNREIINANKDNVDELNASNRSESIVSSDIDIYQSIEQLNKTTGCFPLDRHKSKKSTTVTSKPITIATTDAVIASSKSHNSRINDQKSHRNHFDRLIDRFQSKRIQQNLGVNRRRNSIEHKAFYRWLQLNRTKRLEPQQNCIKCIDADDAGSIVAVDDHKTQRQLVRTPVIRTLSTKSNSIRRKSTKKSTKPSRFSGCIPYCVASSRNDSITGNSLASSQHRFIEYKNTPNTTFNDSAGTTVSASASSDQIHRQQQRRHHHRHLPTTSNDCLMHKSHCGQSNKRCSPLSYKTNRNNNNNNNHNNNCSLFNNLNIMDRSVDSIGSCSLDVDAESTDFSDTSGSLNVCTPLSGKDFTREFTSKIHERCQFPNHQKLQQSKTVLDPNSGKISTILSQNIPTSTIINSPTSPAKKPSYLNLACCVNGYSNLTTYDSKFRQSINKSREVSPIRPITYALQYNRNGDNNYLSVPTAVPINDNNTKNFMMDAHTMVTPEKRYFSTQTQQKAIEINGTSHDITDNVNSNGCAKFYTRSILHTTTSTTNGSANTSLALVRDVNQEFDANAKGASKSFIQQRVERLYGPAAVTQGLYSPKKPKSGDDNSQETSPRTSVLLEKSQNSSNTTTNTTTTFQSTKYVLEAQRNGHLNGLNNRNAHDNENINLDSLNEALPVLRHLRPEFRAQLPTLSPKRTIAISKLTTSSLSTSTAITTTLSSTTTTTNLSLSSSSSSSSSSSPSQAYTNGGTSINGKLNCTTNNVNNKQVTNGVVSPNSRSGDNSNIDDSNRITLDMQSSHKHQLAAFNATNDTTKNGCLTSNKSHDIEIDSRQKQNESVTNNGCNKTAVINCETQSTPNLLVQSNEQPITNTSEMATEINEQPNCLFESQSPMKICKLSSAADVSSGLAMNITTTNTAASVETMDANGNQKTDQKDALYYLNVVQTERDRLINMAIIVEKELDELLQKGDVEEEVLGHLRSAAGKARLLATKKFKQFEGLCNDCINQTTRDMPPPTPGDLQGFWEMVLLQVDNVDSLYADLDKIRANGWKKPIQAQPKQPQGARLTKRPAAVSKSGASSTAPSTASGTTKKSASAIAAAQKREAQRKQLMEMKRKHKMAVSAAANTANDDGTVVDEISQNTSSQASNNDENNTENETDR